MSFDDPNWNTRVMFKLERAVMGPYFTRLVKSLDLKGNERAVELGFGLGNIVRKLSDALPEGNVVGLDPSPYMYRETVKRMSGRRNVTLLNTDLLSAGLEDSSFDLAVIHYVLHEIPRVDQETTLRTLVKKLKVGGRVFIAEPIRESHGIPVPRLRQMFSDAGMREIEYQTKKNLYRGMWEKL
jgi:ubiquinone/menaquinone biosynthesis C-methylase UbiE